MTGTPEEQIAALEGNTAKLVTEKRELRDQIARERSEHANEIKRLRAYIARLESLTPGLAALNVRLTLIENIVHGNGEA